MADSTSNSNPGGTGGNTNGGMFTLHVDASIRNIMQTAQEREIIKTAPDIIVYINGKAYLINPYISPNTGTPYSYVSFNDHVQTFQCSYDVDNLVPSGVITLQVPNHQKYLYQSPGGNNLMQSMMEVQVFAKGYFASESGNTIYYRIFKGLTTNISHTDNGMVLQISIQCLGILHFMDFMYTDLSPSELSNSDTGVTPFISYQAGMNPYQMLGDMFTRPISVDGFRNDSIQEALVNHQNGDSGSDWYDAVQAGYVNKWQPILDNLRREVHILGYRMDKDMPRPDTADNGSTKTTPEAQGSNDPSLMAAKFTITPNLSLVEQASDADLTISKIREYHQDLGIGSLQLVNGRITNRLERIRTVVQVLNYEGYQDVDGTIIFKPPLYNLDVTNIDTNTPSNTTGYPSFLNIRADTNPFVVHLSEIESESEIEDEQGIRSTRVTTSTPLTPNALINQDATRQIIPTVSHIDIPKLAKFGLREEPPRIIPWIAYGDKQAAYSYAVGELVRSNRGWKTYNLTIPLRPELKLGFPMYLPHKDMYGYIKNINISYQVGNAATMSITLDSLRKRPVFPSTHTIQNPEDGTSRKVVVYTTQPNLVMEWTEAPGSTPVKGAKPATSTGANQATKTTNQGAATSGQVGGTSESSPQAELIGIPATIRQSLNKPVYADDLEILTNRRHQWGTSWQTRADTTTKSFRVQNDVATEADTFVLDEKTGKKYSTGIIANGVLPFFSKENWLAPNPANQPAETQTTSNGQAPLVNPVAPTGVNTFYMQKILTCQPYTDEGGYELMTPFPWGRWKSLNEALLETRLGVVSKTAVDSLDTQKVTGVNVFLFAGVGVPSAIDPSSSLTTELSKLNDLSNFAASATSFELVTPPPGTPQDKGLMDTQPDQMIANSLDTVSNRTDVFISGATPPPDTITPLLRTITPPTNNNQIPDAIGVTPSATTQKQTFISKLLNRNKSTT